MVGALQIQLREPALPPEGVLAVGGRASYAVEGDQIILPRHLGVCLQRHFKQKNSY